VEHAEGKFRADCQCGDAYDNDPNGVGCPCQRDNKDEIEPVYYPVSQIDICEGGTCNQHGLQGVQTGTGIAYAHWKALDDDMGPFMEDIKAHKGEDMSTYPCTGQAKPPSDEIPFDKKPGKCQ